VVTYGGIGVTLFFVLSGFLITSLLVREHDAYGNISLSAFYKRRALRILPAFLTFVLLAVVLSALLRGYLPAGRTVALTLGFLTNYRVPTDWWFAHTWSLSCEEQFYLAWPLTVVVLGMNRSRWLALLLVATAPAVRYLTVAAVPRAEPFLAFMLHTRVDALMVGGWMALASAEHGARPLGLRFLGSRWTALGSAALLGLGLGPIRPLFGPYVVPSIEALAGGSLLLFSVGLKGGLLFRVVNSWPAAQLGALSYSLYLWQQPFADHNSTGLAFESPWAPLLALTFALGSYRLVEVPFNVMRARVRRSGQRRPATTSTHAGQSPPLTSQE